MLCTWIQGCAQDAYKLMPTVMVGLRKLAIARSLNPPQTTGTVGISHLRGRDVALPGYQTRFIYAPPYAALPLVSPRRRTKIPDVQTVRALRGFVSQGKARPGPSPQGVSTKRCGQPTVMIGCARNPEIEAGDHCARNQRRGETNAHSCNRSIRSHDTLIQSLENCSSRSYPHVYRMGAGNRSADKYRLGGDDRRRTCCISAYSFHR